jgi:NitT/TauT family transport system permease protein
MIRQPISRRWQIALGASCVVLLAVFYTWLSHRQHQINPRDTTIPSWGQLAEGLVRIFKPQEEYKGRSWFWVDTKATFTRHLAGTLLAALVSVAVGLLMGCYAPAEAFLLPPLSFLAKIPPTAMLAVFFVLAGTGFKMYALMIAFGMLPTLAQAVHQAVKADVPEELVFKAYTLGGSHGELVWNVIFMQVLPRVLEAVRLQVGPAMVYLIAAEMLSADVGYGYRIRLQQRLLNMNVVYVYLVFLGVAGYVMDYSLSFTRRKLCPWFGS